MLRHLSYKAKGKKTPSVSNVNPADEMNLDELYENSRSGLWGLFVFLVASAIAFYFSKNVPSDFMRPDIIAQLGPTPPLLLINCVLGVSTFSSLIIIAGRIYFDATPGKTWPLMLFRVYFFLQYFINGALYEYFNIAFISGLVVIAFQHYNTWNYYYKAIQIRDESMGTPAQLQ